MNAAEPVQTPIRYVALGDSYTSAPFVSSSRPGSPRRCLRSERDFPGLLEERLHPASFTDMSCSGALLRNLVRPQGDNPPQFDALRRDTTLVTLTMGGNDVGFRKWKTCALVSFLDSEGAPCRKRLLRDGTDPFAKSLADTAPRFGAALRRIHQLAPNAAVYVVGYPSILPPTGWGCYPRVPFAQGDVPYLRRAQARTNAMLAAQAQANGAMYVDMSEPGHDACQRSRTERWIEGLLARRAAPFHPNANGVRAMADAVLRAMGEKDYADVA